MSMTNEKNFDFEVGLLGQRISNMQDQVERLTNATIDNTEARQRLDNAMSRFTSDEVAQYWEDKQTYKKFIVSKNDARLVDQVNTQGDLYLRYELGQQAAQGMCLFINE